MQISISVSCSPVASLGQRTYPSKLNRADGDDTDLCSFVRDTQWAMSNGEVDLDRPASAQREEILFEFAGPREKLYFEPHRVSAAIVTCGGLCPGINDVIRSLYLELHYSYGVPRILGVRNGFRGLVQSLRQPFAILSPSYVESIRYSGGTVLGTSRGQQSAEEMVKTLVEEKIDILFCVGGDGTQRGAHSIVEELERRGIKKAIVGIPKTIDNDILHCDRTFGSVTAIEEASKAIIGAHAEAKAARRGIGLVKVMGRDSGFIACGATLVTQEVNFLLIPEVPFRLHGETGFLELLRKRMKHRDHAVVLVAEGAGQDLFESNSLECDASGNRKFHDIGPFLKTKIQEYFKEVGDEPVDIKYIDPSYLVRSVPANCEDSALCDSLARHAVHAAMAGKTDCLICLKNNRFVHIPIPMATTRKKRVDPHGELWAAVLAATGQPTRM